MGAEPDEELVVYRCFRPEQFYRGRGILSDAEKVGRTDIIEDVVGAVETCNTQKLEAHIRSHDGFSSQRQERGIVSPFLSVTTDRNLVVDYAKLDNHPFASVTLRTNRVVLAPKTATLLVIGSIGIEEINGIETF